MRCMILWVCGLLGTYGNWSPTPQSTLEQKIPNLAELTGFGVSWRVLANFLLWLMPRSKTPSKQKLQFQNPLDLAGVLLVKGGSRTGTPEEGRVNKP